MRLSHPLANYHGSFSIFNSKFRKRQGISHVPAVLETPLFRVRTGKSGSHQEKTIYCCSEIERDNAVKELGGTGVSPVSSAQTDGLSETHGRDIMDKLVVPVEE